MKTVLPFLDMKDEDRTNLERLPKHFRHMADVVRRLNYLLNVDPEPGFYIWNKAFLALCNEFERSQIYDPDWEATEAARVED